MTSTLRPLLVPGTRLYRLGAETALIGSNPGVRVALKPGTMELLRLLNGARDLDVLQRLLLRQVPTFTGHVRDVLLPLIQAGALLPHRPPAIRVGTPAIHADGAASDFNQRLTTALLGSTRNDESTATSTAPWHVVITTGEPARSSLDHFVIAGLTHLPIVLDEDLVHLGPLTLPTNSPCLGCYDAHRSRHEPRWHALTTQFGSSALECGVAPSTQFRAISALLERLERDGGESLLGRRVSIGADGSMRSMQFGFAAGCHCHLLAA